MPLFLSRDSNHINKRQNFNMITNNTLPIKHQWLKPLK